MISTHRPIAVNMVAGLVRKCGDVVDARRSSDMADNSSENFFFKSSAKARNKDEPGQDTA